MAAYDTVSVTGLFPALQTLESAAIVRMEAANDAEPDTQDGALLRTCAVLRHEIYGTGHFDAFDPAQWETMSANADRTARLVQRIADTPSATTTGLRGKALALFALLDDGEGGGLYEDAAASDLLAWSLVQDILNDVGER